MQRKMGRVLGLILSLGLSITASAWADAPVVNLDQTNDTTSPSPVSDQAVVVPMQQPLTISQQVKQLQQQMDNLTGMNLPAKLDNVHQQIQQLQGQVEEQTHTIKILQDQLTSFYQDVNQRLMPAKNSSISATAKNSPEASASNNSNSTPKPANSSEQASYQKALNLLLSKKYDQATAALQDYLKQYPNGQFVANSNYWLGEIYFLQNKFPQAAQAFQLLIAKAPHDAKVPDAKLKLALIHDQAGQHDQARKELQHIMQNYPGSSAAQLAKLRLKAMATMANPNGGVEP